VSERSRGWQDSFTGFSLGPAPPGSTLLPGDEARYVREALLASGGMGRVYLAQDLRLGRPVALKEALDGPEAAAALSHEARITATLDHPGVVAVHDVGHTADGRPFCAMRLVRGRTLAAVVDELPTLEERLPLLTHFRDACQAVAYAHDQGVLHRDLKPANLIVGQFGETQVVDWGLAVAVEEAGPGVVGTPSWMAPEAARGAPADRRTDVWGLGAVLYHLLTGQAPRATSDVQTTLSRAASEPPRPVAELTPTAPMELRAIAARALASDPDDRYPDAKALADDVERYLTGARVHAHQYSRAELLARFVRAWRAPLWVAGAAMVLLVALAASSARRLADERDRAVEAEGLAERSLLGSLVAQARQSVSHGATGVAGVLGAAALQLGEHPEARGAIVAALSQWPTRRVDDVPVQDCPRAVLVPDGLLCRSADAVWSVSGGQVRWRTTVAAISLHPAGEVIAAQRATDVVLLDADTGAALGTFPRRSPLPLLGTEDGRFATRRWEGESWMGGLAPEARLPLSGCGEHGLPRDAALHPTRPLHAAWCADGTVAITHPDGRVQQITTGLGVAEHGDASALSWSPDGLYVAIGHTRGLLAWVPIDGSPVRHAPSSRPSGIAELEPSPNGALLATRLDGGEVEIWSTDPLTLVASLPITGVTDLGWTSPTRLRTVSASDTVWEIEPRSAHPLLREGFGLSGVLFSLDGRSLLTTHSDGLVVSTPIEPGGRQWRRVIGRGVVMSAAWTPEGDVLVLTPGEDLTPHVLDPQGRSLPAPPVQVGSRALIPLNAGHLLSLAYQGHGLRIAPDGALSSSGCGAKELRSFSAAADRRQHLLVAIDGEVARLRDGFCEGSVPGLLASRVALSPGGDWLIAATATELVRADLEGTVAWRLPFPPDAAVDLVISPDGTWVAAAGLDQAARVLRAEDGRLVAVLRGHRNRVSTLAFSPDGRRLASGSWDGTARLWSMEALTAPNDVLQAEIAALGWPTAASLLADQSLPAGRM
jgi:WD40 repeat protein